MRTVPGRTDHVVVVGAGLAGLSAALHLLGAGRRVTVLERGPGPGGLAGRVARDGYLMDTGPTVLTLPHLLDEAFAAVGGSAADRLDLLPLDPVYRARFADGSQLAVRADPAAMEAEVERFAGPAAALGYRRLRGWLAELYTTQWRRFIDANHDSPWRLLGADLARLAALGGFGRLDARVGRFVSDPRLRRVFTFQALYAGVAPQRALAAYAVIAYLDTVAGVYFPRGGVHAVPRAMAEAAEQAGARLLFGHRVTALERAGGRIRAVLTEDGRVPCDAVVLTVPPSAAYRLLGRSPRRPVPPRYPPSAVVLHAGTDRSWDGLGHHTLWFGDAWRRTFDELTRDGRPMSDPSLLITRPTATDPSLAPPGRHLHYVLAPCPNTVIGPGGSAWRALARPYRDRLVAELERRGLSGFDAAVESEHLVTPADWAADGYPAGTPFGLAHTAAQTGPFRPRNLVRGTENAVLAGAGTVPGVGVPMVLVSGRLAAARITGAGTGPARRAARPAPAGSTGGPPPADGTPAGGGPAATGSAIGAGGTRP